MSNRYAALQDHTGEWKVYKYQEGQPGYSSYQTWTPVTDPMSKSEAQAMAATLNAQKQEDLGDGLVPAWAPTPRLRHRQRWQSRRSRARQLIAKRRG